MINHFRFDVKGMREKNCAIEKLALRWYNKMNVYVKNCESNYSRKRALMMNRDELSARTDMLGQDGFSAEVKGAARRPWRMQQEGYAFRQEPAYAMVSRRVIDFADNGDGTLTAVRCMDPTASDVDIQFEAGVSPVAAIAPKAFEGCTALRRVILPESLRMIGEMAFSGCVNLPRVVIPGGVVKVGTLAFAKCASLAHVRIEPGVQALGPSCFSKCVSLSRVDIPVSVSSLAGGVFFGCGKQLTLYGAEGSFAQKYAKFNGLAYDSESWRQDQTMILEENEDGTLTVAGIRDENADMLEIPGEMCGRRIAYIAPKAFFANSTLQRVIIGGGVRAIGDSAFFGCRSLNSLSFERGLEHVGDSAFAGCEALTQVTLPWGTASVGRMAFFGCTRLSFAKMPTTTRVSDFAFDGCAQGLRVYGGVNAGRISR